MRRPCNAVGTYIFSYGSSDYPDASLSMWMFTNQLLVCVVWVI